MADILTLVRHDLLLMAIHRSVGENRAILTKNLNIHFWVMMLKKYLRSLESAVLTYHSVKSIWLELSAASSTLSRKENSSYRDGNENDEDKFKIRSKKQPQRRADYRTFHEITTRWADNDAFGHVNNATYYEFFDTAITHWLYTKNLMHPIKGDHVFVAVETGCVFLHQVAYPDRITMGLRIARLGNTSVRWELAVFRDDVDTSAAEGHFVHVYVKRDDRRPVIIPDHVRKLLSPMVMTKV
ncbi:unnamed protein product [Didymodactylos carnosus]|uniref:Thioesterase domain-containing protein n=1 Tax=Didymodactylos carnosus TaxID=1234261 RepID=A0A813V769_9BILA|nr:unnamed protein product [Didymodactylos carnosus]CAF3628326.1 unnamed protein product [Didymodactylos carnosus]